MDYKTEIRKDYTMMQYQEAYNQLEQYGQTHLLHYYDTLSAAEQTALLQQISEMDFSVLERAAHEEAPKGKIEPLGACTISEIAEKQDTYRKIGLEAIRKGSVGAVLLAGGQGSLVGQHLFHLTSQTLHLLDVVAVVSHDKLAPEHIEVFLQTLAADVHHVHLVSIAV